MTEQDEGFAGPESTAACPATGLAAVDAVLEHLADLDRLPVEAHVERFEAVHEGLQHALQAAPAGSSHDIAADVADVGPYDGLTATGPGGG